MINCSETVFIVVYEEHEYHECPRFELLEVFKTRALAECYIGNFPRDDDYYVGNFQILEKKVWVI